MAKKLRERFEAPRDWDFDEMVTDFGFEYLGEYDSDARDKAKLINDMSGVVEYAPFFDNEKMTWKSYDSYG